MKRTRQRHPGIPRDLKEDAKGLFVVDNYGNIQRPESAEDADAFGNKLCRKKVGDRLLFKFTHCGTASQGYASDGSHWWSE